MKARTEELLYFLLWSANQLSRPTFRNLSGSFEQWAYQQGFRHQLWNLERRKLLERKDESNRCVEYRLSKRGRVTALGGHDPAVAWDRSWDGQWRLVLFDLPESRSATRSRLRRFLKDHRFGYLQDSVWITPDPLGPLMKPWSGVGRDVESLITLQAQPCLGESTADIVAGEWKFDRINALYAQCMTVLDQLPRQGPRTRNVAAPLRRWARTEREAWIRAVSIDPLLPRALLPKGYLGERGWKKRQRLLAKASHLAERRFQVHVAYASPFENR